MNISRFRKTVWAYYKKSGRHNLPWRKTKNPYRILVSEVMLQQTQVERVVSFYKKFIKKFPTTKKLATVPLSEVLKTWQGLGYNRRAKQLKIAAQALTVKKVYTIEELEALSGVGSSTARAIVAFAYNKDVIFVETNIRTAVTYHFFLNRQKISDKEIEKILTAALPRGRAREWYSALMDYGAYLKKSGIRLNSKHTHYVKQKKFTGSSREARGAILRELAKGEFTLPHLTNSLGTSRRAQLRAALVALEVEGLIKKIGRIYSLAN
ncbi:MAG: A/G-specific adenine glycosylase [Minisyncoccia bacterium]|jgi:A/G-specific adenine glycosylase